MLRQIQKKLIVHNVEEATAKMRDIRHFQVVGDFAHEAAFSSISIVWRGVEKSICSTPDR